MRLLLDTHTWVWFVQNDPQLSNSARELIEDPACQPTLSAASYWELAIKVSIGKISLQMPIDHFFERAIHGNKLAVLPITPVHAALVADLPFHHRDPFDRMLVAQALVEDIALVSCDSLLDAYGVSRVW
jgi:PIN domain nuclease of toxin-antitoxin system